MIFSLCEPNHILRIENVFSCAASWRRGLIGANLMGAWSIVFDGNLMFMRHQLLSSFLCLFACIPALAQEGRASLFCGPSHNYYCTPEQEIMSMRQEQLNRQRSQPVNNQQNMARYLELEQKRRAMLEQELGRINRQFP